MDTNLKTFNLLAETLQQKEARLRSHLSPSSLAFQMIKHVNSEACEIFFETGKIHRVILALNVMDKILNEYNTDVPPNDKQESKPNLQR